VDHPPEVWDGHRALGGVLGGAVGKEAGFTRYRVGYSCATRYHNIEKARRVLGYVPEVGCGGRGTEDGGSESSPFLFCPFLICAWILICFFFLFFFANSRPRLRTAFRGS
jgi:hypothetical protein